MSPVQSLATSLIAISSASLLSTATVQSLQPQPTPFSLPTLQPVKALDYNHTNAVTGDGGSAATKNLWQRRHYDETDVIFSCEFEIKDTHLEFEIQGKEWPAEAWYKDQYGTTWLEYYVDDACTEEEVVIDLTWSRKHPDEFTLFFFLDFGSRRRLEAGLKQIPDIGDFFDECKCSSRGWCGDE